MNEPTVSGNTQKASSTARTRKHRLNIIDSNCTRLEVTIGADVVAKLDALASRKNESRRHVVEEAIEAFAKSNGVTGNENCIDYSPHKESLAIIEGIRVRHPDWSMHTTIDALIKHASKYIAGNGQGQTGTRQG